MIRQLHYVWSLARSVLAFDAMVRPHRRVTVVFSTLGVCVLVVAGAWRAPATALGFPGQETRSELDELIERGHELGASLSQVETVYESSVAPIERVLMYYKNDQRLTRRIAAALVREAARADLAPDILLAVLLVENPWLDPSAKSFVGARGLMQVMPGHEGQWKACPGSLDDIESNICYGAQIFRDYLRSTKGDIERALLRYNGCVRSVNTPNCQMYPQHVYARAGRAALLSRQRERTDP